MALTAWEAAARQFEPPPVNPYVARPVDWARDQLGVHSGPNKPRSPKPSSTTDAPPSSPATTPASPPSPAYSPPVDRQPTRSARGCDTRGRRGLRDSVRV